MTAHDIVEMGVRLQLTASSSSNLAEIRDDIRRNICKRCTRKFQASLSTKMDRRERDTRSSHKKTQRTFTECGQTS